jgi:hypothetical protein
MHLYTENRRQRGRRGHKDNVVIATVINAAVVIIIIVLALRQRGRCGNKDDVAFVVVTVTEKFDDYR